MNRKPDSNRPGHAKRTGMTQPTRQEGVGHHEKAAEAFVCDTCNVVQHGGRWYWGAPPLTNVHGGLCPACARVRDRNPAGTVRLDQGFLAWADEVTQMITRLEGEERDEHPLERVIEVKRSASGIEVTTTGTHMARRLVSKLKHRFHKAHVHPEEGGLTTIALMS